MAVFILAVIVNNYTTGQVGGCLNTSLSVCLLEIQIGEHIHSLPSTERRLLSGPAVTLKDHSLVYCVFLGDIGYVTVLSPTVTSAISVSVPQPPLRWHFITTGVTSACCWRPVFNPRSLLCLTLIKRPGVRCRDVARHFMESTRTHALLDTLFHKEIFHHHSVSLLLLVSVVIFLSSCECYLTHSFLLYSSLSRHYSI